MKLVKKPLLAALLATSLAACATTSELPLAPNVVRLDTQASGLLFTSAAGAITMKKAAQITLARGYSHFRIEQASMATGSRVTGVYANTTGWGSTSFSGNTASSTFGGSTIYTPMRAPTANVGVTVVMFRANEAGAKGAWDAAYVLKKQGKV